ncbi:MAG: hypothetical protein ACI89E_001815 [Planctomycetota bacterium]
MQFALFRNGWTIPGKTLYARHTPSASVIGMVVDNVCIGGVVGNAYCDAVPNSTGSIAQIGAIGSSSFLSNDLELTTTHLPANSWGLYLVGRTPGFTPNRAGSSGNLCLGGTVGLYMPIHSGSNGAISMPLNWLSLRQPQGSATATVGETWHFQAWYRDSIPGAPTTHFSQGLEVLVTP